MDLRLSVTRDWYCWIVVFFFFFLAKIRATCNRYIILFLLTSCSFTCTLCTLLKHLSSDIMYQRWNYGWVCLTGKKNVERLLDNIQNTYRMSELGICVISPVIVPLFIHHVYLLLSPNAASWNWLTATAFENCAPLLSVQSLENSFWDFIHSEKQWELRLIDDILKFLGYILRILMNFQFEILTITYKTRHFLVVFSKIYSKI